ncbi:unnamed protein product [Brassica oleracea var. botrytis]|uniref:FBD domain-containing protein n=3 Tax=Brassica TaxID=3705 RepID=A0A0D3AJ27_BRAOL|nr:unnamed protein product [Brassica napus]VDD19298.1 unnamed protein product [Brassica oleracea]
MDSVDRVMFAVSGTSAIRRFTLNGPVLRVDTSHTNRWTRNALNHGVLNLPLDRTFHDDSLVLDELACKTLVELKLNFGVKIPILPEDISFPALKSLTLDMARFCNLGAFEKLISACPLLEELIIIGVSWELARCSHILSCPKNLKRLSIRSRFNFSVELGNMSFDIPILVHLGYSDYVQLQYPAVKLDSLVEAKLELLKKYGDRDSYDPSNLFKGVRHVQKLSLSFPETVEGVLFISLDSTVSTICNKEISKCTHTRHRGSLVCGHDHSDFVCRCFSVDFVKLSSPVKVLELTMHEGSSDEMEQIKRFLEDLSCLELVKVRAFAKEDEEKLRLATGLLMLPRASSKCKIHVEFC